MNRYETHKPVLEKMIGLEITSGPVLELGVGSGSTQFLHEECEKSGRPLVSVDGNAGWLDKFRHLETWNHRVVLANDWDDCHIIDQDWGLVFIDHAPAYRRGLDAARLAHSAKFIVLHGTEPEWQADYGYALCLPQFKYRFDYTTFEPWTSVVSMFYPIPDLHLP